ncbi:major facilitator transporter [Caballeronia choica]|jgi:MFS transporter, AAHS family, benzoate transport protein|uniref:Major facilitator transporter n=1 Tax=Caballeronia choica TaxID=326476 RepID=A0A158L262_9BURK|nr:major facilitator transporter [Caballeronia choica]
MRQLNVHEIADGARFGALHAVILLICTLIIVADGYDLAIMGAALPSVMKDLNVAPAQAGMMVSAGFIGLMIGAIAAGMLADRVGRRKTMAACVVVFSIVTACTGLVHDAVLFGIVRFVAGIGIGGVMPCVVAHVTEFAPRKHRATMVTVSFSGFAIGGMLAAVLGNAMIEAHGWRSVFFVAAVPLLVVPFVVGLLPESIAYLVRTRRVAELRAIVRGLHPRFEIRSEDALVVPACSSPVPVHDDVSVGLLFREGRLSSTIMLWLASFMCVFVIYGLASWLAKMMTNAGYSLGSALNLLLALNVGALVGGVSAGLLADRFPIKVVLCSFYLLASTAILVSGSDVPVTWLHVTTGILGASSYGGQMLTYAYAGQFYPPAIRSSGVGWVTGVGRLGAILAPVAFGALMALQLPRQLNFLVIAIPMFIAAAAVAMIGHGHSCVKGSARDIHACDGSSLQ